MIVNERFPDVSWRELKYYVAAEAGGHTFLAMRSRGNGLIVGLTLPSDATAPGLTDNSGEFNWGRMTKVTRIQSPADVTATLLELMGAARQHARLGRVKQHFGVTLRDLIDVGILNPGSTLVFTSGSRVLAQATLNDMAEIVWEGRRFKSLSDKAFARLLGPTRETVNGWTHWVAELTDGPRTLADLRAEYLDRAQTTETPVKQA